MKNAFAVAASLIFCASAVCAQPVQPAPVAGVGVAAPVAAPGMLAGVTLGAVVPIASLALVAGLVADTSSSTTTTH